MFTKILHANDGSENAFHALAAAITLAKENRAELHMVAVEELLEFAETIGEVRNHKKLADRHFREVIKRANAMADEKSIKLKVHLLAGHPVRTIVEFAESIDADLLVIGARGHSAL